MQPNFKGRQLSRVLIFWGAIVLAIFGVFLAAGRFDLHSGGRNGNMRNAVITRQDSPVIYWGVESSILLVGLMLLTNGITRARNESDGDNL